MLALTSAVRGSEPRPRIVVLGDSLASGRGIGATKAFPAILQEKLDEAGLDYEMVNGGVSGDTSAGGLRRFERLLDGNVRILDRRARCQRWAPRRPCRSDEGQPRAHHRSGAIARHHRIAVPNGGAADLRLGLHRSLSQSVRRAASKYDVPPVPFILMNVIGNRDLMQPDRAHPNVDGARAIADNIWPHLKPLLTRTLARQ